MSISVTIIQVRNVRWGSPTLFIDMPAIVRSEFALALNQVCSERGIDPEVVLETIRQAILMAYKKDRFLSSGENIDPLNYLTDLDPVTGEFLVFEKLPDGSKGKDITPPDFGRIAAQTAKQGIIQRIRAAEKNAVIDDFTTRIGTVTSGTILRSDGPNWIIDINKAEAVMPPLEQTSSERYAPNQRLTVYIKEIREGARGSEIIVSRASEGLIKGLFKREVPEVQNEAVEITEMAREAGGRTKLAVTSKQSGVDPVGACVGQKGVRVQAVIADLGGTEKVDIIQYDENPVTFIARALAPAKDIEVILDEKNKSAIAIVPDDQQSLAIGRDGQNVRLAAKLTKWKIDIKGKSQYQADKITEEPKVKKVKKAKKEKVEE